MDRFVSIGLEPVPAADAAVNALSSTVFYGKGVFTNVRIHECVPFLWEKHWKRLCLGLKRLGIDNSDVSGKEILGSLTALLHRNERKDGRARIAVLDNDLMGPWNGRRSIGPTALITTADHRTPADRHCLAISPYDINSKSPLNGVKSCNYLEPLMALDEAKGRGFNEALRLNESGEIASGCVSNVFWSNGERLFTPSLKTGCLPGTTREFVIENLECEEVEAGIEALREVDDIFLTSAGIGIVQAAEFDGRILRRREHPIKKVLPF
ncbi:MAG TPA: aminotransferase class IV [Pyrinomonadaceae bacterium]|nr:aminotransferase class IV [Pyrinomonadaceae bacterium]